MGSFQGVPHFGCLLNLEAEHRLKVNDPLFDQAGLDAAVAEMRALADSEGTRAVTYLRRARKAEGEREVLARWAAEACGVLFSVEEEAEDGGESLRMLRERGLRLVRAVLGPPPLEAESNGPQCNLNTPWLAP
jgi:hypothetical protein